MKHSDFRRYKKGFVDSARQILAQEHSESLDEAAFPAYANKNPMISFLFWERIRKVMLSLDRGEQYSSVMDFGCGSGVLLPFLSKLSSRVMAVDIDLSPLRKMERYISFSDRVHTCDLRKRTLTELIPASFDIVLALDVLEHVEDLVSTTRDLCRLLKPGGRVVFSGPTENLAYRLGRRIAGKEYHGHYHVRNIYDIKSVMSGFVTIQTVATLFYPVPLFKIYSGTASFGTDAAV